MSPGSAMFSTDQRRSKIVVNSGHHERRLSSSALWMHVDSLFPGLDSRKIVTITWDAVGRVIRGLAVWIERRREVALEETEMEGLQIHHFVMLKCTRLWAAETLVPFGLCFTATGHSAPPPCQ